jgi:hypothetical protein
MKKKLNVDQIQSELRGGSAFFPGYKGSSENTSSSKMPQEMHAISNVRTNTNVPVPVPPPVPRTGPRTPPALVPKVRRPIRQRQPFDIYEDQYKRLKAIAAAEQGYVNGRGMSQMVRDAIDSYLRDHGISKDAKE